MRNIIVNNPVDKSFQSQLAALLNVFSNLQPNEQVCFDLSNIN
jgi:hypothetical protein